MRIIAVAALALNLAFAAMAQKSETLPLATFQGTVKSIDHKKIMVDEEGNTMDFYLSRRTRVFNGEKEIKPSELKTGDRVKIEAVPRLDGSVDAITIRVQKSS
jgi:hypothetical protein